MEKDIYLKDYLASRLIAQKKSIPDEHYGRMYYQTNEDLIDTYLDVDFYQKDVLSVLASSDQFFTARFLNAKTVEAFDKNRLTMYYFFLRRWTIKYRGLLYPRVFENPKWLKELLKEVIPETELEKKAYEFFMGHINDKTDISGLFFWTEIQPSGCTLYQSAEELQDCISPELTFYGFDLLKKQEFEKQYDIVLASNILDWARNKKDRLLVAADNLQKLVRTGGAVICSNLIYRPETVWNIEKDAFSPYFEREDKKDSYVYYKK